MPLAITIGLGCSLRFLIGLTGVGGGALVAPALYVILGLSYREAVALSFSYALITKVISAIQHLRQGTVRWKVTLLYGGFGVPGAVFGSKALYWFGQPGDRVFPFLLAGLLLVVAILLFWEVSRGFTIARAQPFSPTEITVNQVLVVGAIQVFVGLLLGITSVGAGSLVILWMLYLFRMNVKEIVGSNIIVALVMVAPAGLTHYIEAGVQWSLLAQLAAGSLFGAVLGAKATVVVRDRPLKITIVLLIVAGAIATMVRAWATL